MRGIAYAAVAIYLGVQAASYILGTTEALGISSSVFLLLATLAVVLMATSVAFLFQERAGVPLDTPVWQAARVAWLLFTVLLIGVRIVVAFNRDQETVGLESAINAARFIWSVLILGCLIVVARPPKRPAPVAESVTPGKIGRYEIRGLLGRGAMGAVHDGWDPLIGRRVAIKTILLDHASTSDSKDSGGLSSADRFRREAQAAGRLLHPNVVSVFDYEERGGTAYLVMEFVDGQPLGDYLTQQKRLPVAEVLRIMDDILAGLGYCHEQGVVHRDIKPANVMLTKAGRAKIADFGIARVDSGSMTQTGMITGTAAYMSPEQFAGGTIDARSDIYACGVLLYLMLTGERPFSGGGATEIMFKVMNEDVPTPSLLAPVPAAFDVIVKQAMAKSPADRFAKAAAFAAALRVVEVPPEDETTVVPRG